MKYRARSCDRARPYQKRTHRQTAIGGDTAHASTSRNTAWPRRSADGRPCHTRNIFGGMKMKIVVFGPARRVGALIGEKIIDLNAALTASLREAGAAGLDEARRVIDRFSGAAPDQEVVHNAAAAKIHAPWPERRIACVGGNYAAHLAGMWANRLGKTDVSIEQITEEARKAGQWGFWKVPA